MLAERDAWSALANPVRREILDALRDGPRSTGWLAESFPELSRFAVMQHLGVLESAGLLVVRRDGRNRLNFINPAPLEEIRSRWLNRFSSASGRAALALKHHLEQPVETIQQEAPPVTNPNPTPVARAVRVECELRIEAPASRVFEALTTEQHRWYPYTYGGDRVRDIVFEPRVGGSCYEDWGDGAGHWYSTVTHYDPPSAVTLRGALPGGTTLENTFALAADGDATVVRHSMVAFGELTDEEVAGIHGHGTISLFEPQLRAWLEHNQPVR